MADNLPVSQLQDKTGNTYDIAAKRFSGTRTLTLTGDVNGSVTDNFSGNVAISVGIADNAIDTSCIADGAVTVSKIADTAVTESKLSTELQTKIDTASDASHTHDNKALLDTYTQTEANLADAVSKKHSHANSAVLSKYAGGKGSASIPVYIASDGTPTACTDDFARDSEVALKEDKSNKVTSWSATTTDAHYPSEKLVKTALDGKQGTLAFDGTYNASTNKVATVSSITDRINQLDSTVTSTDGTNVQVKVTETNGQISAVNVTTDNTENKNNKVTSWSATTSDTKYPSEKLVKTSLDSKQDNLPTSGTASSTYAINISGNAATATSATSDGSGQNIVDTYATKTEIGDKNFLKGQLLTSSDNILDVANAHTGEFKSFYFLSESAPAGLPDDYPTSGGYGVITSGQDNQNTIELHANNKPDYYYRYTKATSSSWVKVYYSATNTYSSTSEQPISGKGVADALVSSNGYTVKTSVEANTSKSWIKACSVSKVITTGNINITSDVVLNGTTAEKRGRYNISVRVQNGTPTIHSHTYVFDVNDITGYDVRPLVTVTKDSSTNKFTVDLYTFFDANKQYLSLTYENLFAVDYNGWTIPTDVSDHTKVKTEPSGDLVQYAEYVANAYIKDKHDVGSSSVPVYVNQNGTVIACTTADLKAGKDASGNVITSTYATKTEVNGKMSVTEVTVGSGSPVDLHSYRTIGLYNFTSSSTTMFTDAPVKLGTGAAMTGNNASMYVSVSRGRVHQLLQYSDTDGKCYWFARSLYGSTVTPDWQPIILGRNIRKSNDVSSFTTDDAQAYTGKAIAEYVAGAIGGNVGGYMGECSKADIYTSTTNFHDFKLGDWFVASEAGTYTYRVDGTNKTLANVTVGAEIYFTTDKTLEVKPTTAYELTANKATSIDSSTTKYPTNNAVKTYVDNGISNLSDTYATKTEVNNKNELETKTLTSADDLDSLDTLSGTTTAQYRWLGTTRPVNSPDGNDSVMIQMGSQNRKYQFVFPREVSESNYYWERQCIVAGWTTWKKVYYEATSSYSATGTQAVNGTAVAAALSTAVAPKVSVDAASNGTWYNVIGTDGTGEKSLKSSPDVQVYKDAPNGSILVVGNASEGVANSGQIRINSSAANGFSKLNSAATASRTNTLPDKNGTILVDADVSSTYSATGTAPVNGKAIKEAFDGQKLSAYTVTSGTARKWISIGLINNWVGNTRIEVFGVRNSDGASFHADFHPRLDSGTVTCIMHMYSTTNPNVLNTFKWYKQVTGTGTTAVTTLIGCIEHTAASVYNLRVRVMSSNSVSIVDEAKPSSGLTEGTYTLRGQVFSNNGKVGNTDTAVFVDTDGTVKAIATADLKAGKDGSGNTITSTYATKTELGTKQDNLPTSGTASATYAINISGTAADSTKLNGQSASYYAKQSDMGATYISATETLKFTGITFS